MAQLPKYYIVEAQALPEVFLKVAEAKWLLETGEVATVNDAARATGHQPQCIFTSIAIPSRRSRT